MSITDENVVRALVMFVAEDYKWVGTLGTPNQFRGVKYAESTDDNYCRVRCLLCGTGWMGRGARINHFHGDKITPPGTEESNDFSKKFAGGWR